MLLPGFPEKVDSPVSASHFEDRTVTEIDFSDTGLRIGPFAAHDFFGDGSFYLLGESAPKGGHRAVERDVSCNRC